MNKISSFPIKHWDKISDDIYKDMINEAKIKLDEIVSQSENITDKCIKMLVINGAILLWFSKYVSDNSYSLNPFIVISISILLSFNFWNLITIVFPRSNVRVKGTSPSAILESNVSEITIGDDKRNYSDSERQKVYYYLQCWRYDDSIISYREKLEARAIKYKYAIVLSTLGLLFVSLVFLVTSL